MESNVHKILLKTKNFVIFGNHHCNNALLACAYTTPAEKLISASDARKLTAKGFQDGISKANDLMKEIHSKVASMVPSSQVASIAPLLGLFESQLVYLALDKKHKDITVMSTMEHACLALCKEVHEAIGITLSTQWDNLDDPSGPTGKASTKRLSKPREYDSEGKLKDPFVLLHESGFVPGAWITRKQDKLVAKLLKLENDQVVIECDGGQYIAQMSAFLENKWTCRFCCTCCCRFFCACCLGLCLGLGLGFCFACCLGSCCRSLHEFRWWPFWTRLLRFAFLQRILV